MDQVVPRRYTWKENGVSSPQRSEGFEELGPPRSRLHVRGRRDRETRSRRRRVRETSEEGRWTPLLNDIGEWRVESKRVVALVFVDSNQGFSLGRNKVYRKCRSRCTNILCLEYGDEGHRWEYGSCPRSAEVDGRSVVRQVCRFPACWSRRVYVESEPDE